jgi:hypothetical protein
LTKASVALATLLLPACEGGEGELKVTIYGEAFIEDSIPAEVFADGWSVTFDRFLVVVRDVAADDHPLPGTFVFDLAQPSSGGHDVGTVVMPAGTVSDLAYRIAPLRAETVAGNTDSDDVALLRGGPFSLFLSGTAMRDDEVVRFSWGLATDTAYGPCTTNMEVEADRSATSQITVHGDHMFYDDLDSPTPNVAFDLIASADADGDGDVTEAELRLVDISSEERYQVGSRDITDLWTFLEVQSTTLGHIDGEGHCETEAF